ncbi:MAG: beta-ketoacyl-[acyl-carrier-protein] synthase family protein [Zoogloeaceae bacterium]|jgi:3-oxoacyl-[acyl-carrier-protein] synthase II|nr:beta-ketoacyl-[acyl-carrier-protein] synthase family protein [Zoogloeaceae bacterium]
MRRVVITGIGPVCAGKIGAVDFFQGLLAKKAVLCPIAPEYERHYRFNSRFFVPAPRLPETGDAEKGVDDFTRIALHCAALALQDAGLDNLAGGGVILGVGMGGLNTALPSYVAHATGAGRFNRLVIPLSMPNAAAAWIGIRHGADRDGFTVNAACASGTVALGEALRKIQDGRLELVLSGGVECLTDPSGAMMRGFDALQTLTRAADGLPRPFSKQRSGFLFNMGAGCALVLEERERAMTRGARIYAELLDYAACTAASNIVALPEDPAPLIALFKIAAGLRVDYFNAHGTGTVQSDRVERDIIRAVWGEDQPYVSATKGIIGHCLGASGALEAAATALSIHHGQAHGNLTDDLMEGVHCPLDSADLAIEHALSASYGFGGHHALLLLKKHRP